MNIKAFLFPIVVSFVSITANAQTKQAEIVKNDSWMTYRLTHPLHEIEATSKDVVYHMDIDAAKKEIHAVWADVDVTTFDSGNSNRDSHAMEVIDAIDYPEATFESSSVTPVGDSLHIAGKMTFHGVTKDIVLAVKPTWISDSLKVVGSFELSLTAFKIERPALLLIPVEDALHFTFAAVFVLH
ncbi:MAG TPA: YceI family protein [Bacteroidota bacterium]|nr:YceI family protein [Bacteroidota bacterium]